MDAIMPQPDAPIEDVAELSESIRLGHPRISWLELAAVGAGGAVGGLARVGAQQAWPAPAGGWPWATIAVNIAGAFVLGCLMTALRHGPLSIPTYRLLGTGFCGALTTFSAMQLQLLEMLDRSRYGLAAGYIGASLIGGYAAVSVAERLIRQLTVGVGVAVGAGVGEEEAADGVDAAPGARADVAAGAGADVAAADAAEARA